MTYKSEHNLNKLGHLISFQNDGKDRRGADVCEVLNELTHPMKHFKYNIGEEQLQSFLPGFWPRLVLVITHAYLSFYEAAFTHNKIENLMVYT